MVRVLHAVDAAFERRREQLVAPFSIALGEGERGTLEFPTGRAAAIAARMVAGIVKSTTGTLFIGDFDPRIQPVQAKRSIGFVPAAGDFGDPPREASFAPGVRDAIDLHAALYEVERDRARLAAFAVLAAFDRVDGDALALALALIRPIGLLVLDRPSPVVLERALGLVASRTAVVAVSGAR